MALVGLQPGLNALQVFHPKCPNETANASLIGCLLDYWGAPCLFYISVRELSSVPNWTPSTRFTLFLLNFR